MNLYPAPNANNASAGYKSPVLSTGTSASSNKEHWLFTNFLSHDCRSEVLSETNFANNGTLICGDAAFEEVC